MNSKLWRMWIYLNAQTEANKNSRLKINVLLMIPEFIFVKNKVVNHPVNLCNHICALLGKK